MIFSVLFFIEFVKVSRFQSKENDFFLFIFWKICFFFISFSTNFMKKIKTGIIFEKKLEENNLQSIFAAGKKQFQS